VEKEFDGLIDAKEAALMFKVSVDTIYKYSKAGWIPSVKVGDILRFDRWTLVKLIRNHNRTK
jgi:excisionase family DNA binding protein